MKSKINQGKLKGKKVNKVKIFFISNQLIWKTIPFIINVTTNDKLQYLRKLDKKNYEFEISFCFVINICGKVL